MAELFDMVRRPRSRPPGAEKQGRQQGQLRHSAEAYLNGDLKARLNLTNTEMFAGNYQNAFAQSPHGKLLVKFYPDYATFKVHRCVLAHALVTRHGLRVPELVHVDTSEEGLEKHGLSCVVLRWVTGTPIAFGDEAATDRAFKLLALMHRITVDDVDESLLHDFAGSRPYPADCAPGIREFSYEMDVIRRATDAIAPEEALAVEEFMVSQLNRAHEFKLPRVLLHMDYQPGNLILTSGGEIVTIDFEGSTFGEFYVDLARALFKFGYKTASMDLDRLDIEHLAGCRRFDFFMAAYCSEAPDEAKAFWAEKREIVVLWGYLKAVRSLAQKLVRLRESGSLKQRRIAKRLRLRWEKVLRYVERSARTC